MKKVIALVLVVLMFSGRVGYADAEFDLSIFENSDLYKVNIDYMDDTGLISLVEGGGFISVPTSGATVVGNIDIRIVEGVPPVMRFAFVYYGDDWIFVDKVIFKTRAHRYTFEVTRQTEVDKSGKVYEMFVVVLSDTSIQLLEDIINDYPFAPEYRLSGKRNVDSILILNNEAIKTLYSDYIAAGGMEGDFTQLRQAYPCEIK